MPHTENAKDSAKENAKRRILNLRSLLLENTDENHPLTTNEISRLMMEKYGVEMYRTTVGADVEDLKACGLDVYTEKSTQNRYFVNSRIFDLPELKMLIDAVEASKFITEKKSRELVKKLSSLAGVHHAAELKRNLYTEKRLKSANEKLYYIVDAVNEAINAGKKIEFRYFRYDAGKNKVLKHGGESYVISPYVLTCDGDYYYVIGYSERRDAVCNFRVDRIYARPTVLSEDARPKERDFDIADYINSNFRMFAGKRETVEILCENSVMNPIIDRFGENVRTVKKNEEQFYVTADVALSPMFYRWVFGFDGKVVITSPESVKKEYAGMLARAVRSVSEEAEAGD